MSYSILLKTVGAISVIFSIAVIAVSALLLQQALLYHRENNIHASQIRSFNNYGSYNRYNEYEPHHDYEYQNPRTYTQHEYYHREQEYYVYNPVIIISSAGIIIGSLQLIVACCLCLNMKSLTLIWMGGHVLLLLFVIVSFSLGFYYNVIYKEYKKEYYSNIYNRYYNNNPRGQAFCAILGLDLVLILGSLIFVGVLKRKADVEEEKGLGWNLGQTGQTSDNNYVPEVRVQ